MKGVVVIGVLLLLVLGSALAFAIDCPSCGMTMVWTGETRTEWGKLVKVFRCPAGHEYLVTAEQERADNQSRFDFNYDNRQDNSRSYSYGQVVCPVCGMTMYFTGRTRTEWGKLQKIYRCPAGHEAVAEE